MADPFKVIGGTGGDGGGRPRPCSFNSLFAAPFAAPLIPGDYHLMPPLGRQFRKTARCCSLSLRGQTSRLENVSARSGFNRISKFITAAGGIMDSKSRPQTSYNSRPRKNLSQHAAGGIIAGRTFYFSIFLSFSFFFSILLRPFHTRIV